jgi:hypothetical protein
VSSSRSELRALACVLAIASASPLVACSLRDLSDLTSGTSQPIVDAGPTCAKDCLGGACVDGKCQPMTLISGRQSPWGIAVDNGTVYWSELGAPGVPGLAFRLDPSADGGAASASKYLVTDVDPTWLSIYGGKLLWAGMTRPFAVGRCPVPGHGCTFHIGFTPFPAGTIVADGLGTTAYVNNPDRVVGDASGIYWTNAGSTLSSRDGSVVVCRATGCGSPPPQLLALFQSHPRGIALDDTYVYWVNQGLGTDPTDGAVLRIPKAGGTAQKLAEGLTSPAYLAVDAKNVYWTNGDGTVMVASKTGGDARVFADGQGGAWDIAVDDSGVYWTTQGPSGTIAMCAATGCAGGVTVLAKQNEPYGITLDDSAIYWTTFDPTDGAVMKLAKP